MTISLTALRHEKDPDKERELVIIKTIPRTGRTIVKFKKKKIAFKVNTIVERAKLVAV